MDIKQEINAVAVVTLGKDMVFRDYSQGAYRMRGEFDLDHVLLPHQLFLLQALARVKPSSSS